MQFNAGSARRELGKYADKSKAVFLQRFFKTGKGQYAEGDLFLGINVPVTRKVAKDFEGLSLDETVKILRSPFHEERLLALILLVIKFKKAQADQKRKIYSLYLNNTGFINNWDLVDLSAPEIVGGFLFDKAKTPVYRLARSKDLWQRRIAIVATFYFIKNNKFNDTLKIARLLLDDKEDLIHKAAGWMLREVGKRNLDAEERFLKKHYKIMPRTMLRYAIERFSQRKRVLYLSRSGGQARNNGLTKAIR